MKDSIGGIFNLAFLAVFITIISGYLAFTVSYSKAFKVKNKIISVIEQYQGMNDTSRGKIEDYIAKIGYSRDFSSQEARIRLQDIQQEYGTRGVCENGYCYVCVDSTKDGPGTPRSYYSVITFVNVPIPIFEHFLPYLSFFQTKGDTMTMNTSCS